MVDEGTGFYGRCADLSSTIGQFLFDNQCILESINLSGDVQEERLQFTRNGPVLLTRFSVSGKTLRWSCGQNTGEAKEGEFFRLNPFATEIQQPAVDSGARSGGKIATRLRHSFLMIYEHWKLAGFDFETRRLAADFCLNLVNHKRDSGAGFLAKWRYVSENKICVKICDFGGILDDNPNVEGAALGPRVMADYYADAYAAYIFIREYLAGGGDEWKVAALDVLDFIAESYEGYPRGVVWYHHEFKNPAILECILLLEQANIEISRKIRNLPNIMRLDSYEPTNVFALRLYWKGLLAKMTNRSECNRMEACRVRLRNDTTVDGLILDENPPAYCGARDLTYHQYSLACLAGYLANCEDPAIVELFLEGCRWTINTRLSNGEVSYNGRGANNIYHVAASMYALTFASKEYGLRCGDLSPMLSLLEARLEPDGALPTAMNQYGSERMGWNHCRTPYNALTAFYLRLIADKGSISEEPIVDGVCEKKGTKLLTDSGYVVHRTSQYSMAFFAGIRESYVYSQAHKTGVSGTAAVLPYKCLPLYLTLDRSLRCPATLTTDLPTIVFNGLAHEPIGGVISYNDQCVTWTKEALGFSLLRKYEFQSASVRISNELKIHRNGDLSGDRWLALPLHGDSYEWDETRSGFVFREKRDSSVNVCALVVESSDACGEWQQEPVISNPRGRGVILKKSLDECKVEAGSVFKSAWRLDFYE